MEIDLYNVNTIQIIAMLAKDDPIIRHVWDHYFCNKQKTPLNPNDVKYFWEKVNDCLGNINDDSKKTTTITT